jgi:hypothetical protein
MIIVTEIVRSDVRMLLAIIRALFLISRQTEKKKTKKQNKTQGDGGKE